jgi:hypothetical protein
MHLGLRECPDGALADHGRNLLGLPRLMGCRKNQRARDSEALELSRKLAKRARSKYHPHRGGLVCEVLHRISLSQESHLRLAQQYLNPQEADRAMLVGRLAFRPTSS